MFASCLTLGKNTVIPEFQEAVVWNNQLVTNTQDDPPPNDGRIYSSRNPPELTFFSNKERKKDTARLIF